MRSKSKRAKLRDEALQYIQGQGAHTSTITSFMAIFDAWVKFGNQWKEHINENTVAVELFEEYLSDELEED